MNKLNSNPLKKIIIYCFTFVPKVIRRLKRLAQSIIQLTDQLTHLHSNNTIELAKKILKKNKLDILLDNIACPEEGRKLLYLLFKIKHALPPQENNIIIARDSLVNGYLTPIIEQLALKTAPVNNNLHLYLRNLPKVSTIYSLDSAFSMLLFDDAPYLIKLRAQCKDELIIAVKIHIPEEKQDTSEKSIYTIEKNDIYYTDHHIRWMLHYIGFFEVLGPFTPCADDYFTRSRMITPEGEYAVILNKQTHPPFKGISIYRAATKTFRHYTENNQ